MKTTKQSIANIILFLAVLLAAQSASAFYDPSTGRWLSRDPIGEPGFQALQQVRARAQSGITTSASGRWIKRSKPDNENRYLYVNNNPVSYVDPLGLSVADVANLYSKFVDTLKDMCACHLTCPEKGWQQNLGGYWGCTKQTENLQSEFDKLKFEDGWDITVNYDTSRFPLNHNSVRLKPHNPDDPIVDADTWKGCFSATWPSGSSQQNFSKCFTCKELLGK